MRKITFTLFILLFFQQLFAQQDNFWTPVNESAINRDLFVDSQRPDRYQLFQLDMAALRQHLGAAPHERAVTVSNSAFIVSFPNADGQIERFRIVEAPVMHPDLAARYPGIFSYAGQGMDNPASTIRFDFSPAGLHAVILSSNKPSVYVDVLAENYYRVVSRNDVKDYHRDFRCLTDNVSNPVSTSGKMSDADDGNLRTYRLALISAGEFSQHWLNGTEPDDVARKAKVLIAQNSHITRANAVFERDFGVRLVLVANNDAVIFLDPATDPFPNPNSPSGTTVQNTNDAFIGSANYDIGHLESKGNDNGNAGCIGCVCTAGQKGRGWTVYNNPSLLDFFVIDYLTHEIGHQMGANHTFTFGNEGTWVQVEPGSGSTIMGYAGITGATDVQPHSDEYFHSASIDQVTAYIKSAQGNCAVATVTGNTPPVVDAGSNYIIPRSTPFRLAGSASDADAGDILTYSWEQLDAMGSGSSTFPSATATAGPQFRSRTPSTAPFRILPELSSVLSGANGNQWEVLPSVQRILNFRFTVRDNHPGGGSTKSDDMQVTISGSAGPFFVNSPATWLQGNVETVTWSVAGSDVAPVSCSHVNILLSTDGGQTFTHTLVANTPNDGTQTVTVPAVLSTTCRIKVEAVGNIFFDINNSNFTIALPPSGFTFNNPAAATVACSGPASADITLNTTPVAGFSTPINLSASGNPAGTSVSFSVNPVVPGNSTVVTLNNTNGLNFGSYTITVTGTAGASVVSRDLTFVVQESGAGPAITTEPSPVTVCEGGSGTFSVAATGATSYQWYLSVQNGPFSAIPGATSPSYAVTNASTSPGGQRYAVRVYNQCNSNFSLPALLTVATAPLINAHPQHVTLCAGANHTFSVTNGGTNPSYQWQVSTDGGATYNNIAGANGASYSLTGIAAGMNENRYRVVISGDCPPSVVSNAAILTVVSPVTIATQPLDVAVCETGTTSFNVSAQGSGIIYQWQVSNNGGLSYAPAGSNTAVQQLTASAIMNNFKYRVLLSNATCTTPTISDVATLTVYARPVVSLSAAPYTSLFPGLSTTLTANTTPAAGLNYVWLKDGNVLPAVTSPAHTIGVSGLGAYKVVVTDANNCTNQSQELLITDSSSNRLFIYPSPNSGEFTVSYHNESASVVQRSITIYNAIGEKMYFEKFNASGPYHLLNITMRPAAAGIYLVVIRDTGGNKLAEGKVMVY